MASARTLALAAAVAALLLIAGAADDASPGGGCLGQKKLFKRCKKYVNKGYPQAEPSKACCKAMRKTGFSCLCEALTSKVLSRIDVAHLCYVIRECHMPSPAPGSKCGALTVPNCC